MTGLASIWADLIGGVALGLAIAAPIGPTGMLCIQRTLAGGARAGLATGYGAATVHAGFATIAAAGLLQTADRRACSGAPLRVVAAGLLLRMAVLTVRRRLTLGAGGPALMRPRMAFATGLAWTVGNPVTLATFVALTPSMLGPQARNWQDMPVVVMGVLLGSAAWWTALGLVVATTRRRLTEARLRWANVVTGLVLAGLALWQLAGVARAVS